MPRQPIQERPLKCIFCQAEAPDDADFCSACGGRLGWRCTRCSERNPTPFLRCRGCGAENPHRAQSPELLRSERKVLTVLFADIRGSLELIHGQDPEQASAMLEGSINLMIQAVPDLRPAPSVALMWATASWHCSAHRAQSNIMPCAPVLSALRIRETRDAGGFAAGRVRRSRAIALRVGLAVR